MVQQKCSPVIIILQLLFKPPGQNGGLVWQIMTKIRNYMAGILLETVINLL